MGDSVVEVFGEQAQALLDRHVDDDGALDPDGVADAVLDQRAYGGLNPCVVDPLVQ